jgi:hypothetical protein
MKKPPGKVAFGKRKKLKVYYMNLAAAHTVTAIHTLVAGTATYSDVTTSITGWCVALHVFVSRIHGI